MQPRFFLNIAGPMGLYCPQGRMESQPHRRQAPRKESISLIAKPFHSIAHESLLRHHQPCSRFCAGSFLHTLAGLGIA